jgi:hypothetical protein
MAEENIQGANGPHVLQAPLEHSDREAKEGEDFGIISAPGTAPALEDEPVE